MFGNFAKDGAIHVFGGQDSLCRVFGVLDTVGIFHQFWSLQKGGEKSGQNIDFKMDRDGN